MVKPTLKKYRDPKKAQKKNRPLSPLPKTQKKVKSTFTQAWRKFHEPSPRFEKPAETQPLHRKEPAREKYQPRETPAVPLPPARKAVFVDSLELPSNYNTTNITLIARDPHWLYAYWEIASSSFEDIKKKIGNEFERSSLVLRMYDVTYKIFDGTNANCWFDIDVGFGTRNWYINVWNDNVTYCCDIGIRTPDGKFFTLSRSNPAATPRSGSSNRGDIVWMDVKDDPPQQPFVVVEIQKKTKSNNSWATISKRKIYLSEDDIRAYYSRLFPLLRKIIASRLAREALFKKGTHRYRLYLGDFESFGGVLKRRFLTRFKIGASEEMVLLEGASESLLGGASEKAEKKRKFFFEIGTELIVYGRTEPDAEVWLEDKKITLRKDGTFSLRFALPDSTTIPLRFTAQSRDTIDTRKIATAVERSKTKYNP